MATFLLTWNPLKQSGWDELPDNVATVQRDGVLVGRWSCGGNKQIMPGDRVFLLRQGNEPRGIMGRGTVTAGSYEDDHWDDSRAGKAVYVDVAWDTLSENPIITRRELDGVRFNGVHWNTQSSGITIQPSVADALEQDWQAATGLESPPLAEQIDRLVSFPEGAVQTVTINAYERNPRARAACIAHYGTQCSLCGCDFGEAYGPVGEGLIHVHHLTSIAKVGRRYRVNPITDLRPVCPNCHAMIHRKNPCYSIDEVKKMLNRRR